MTITHSLTVVGACCFILQITFDWGWSKGPLSGSGYGELSLQGGALDEIFLVRAWLAAAAAAAAAAILTNTAAAAIATAAAAAVAALDEIFLVRAWLAAAPPAAAALLITAAPGAAASAAAWCHIRFFLCIQREQQLVLCTSPVAACT
jgi:hypothetical protein